MTDTDIKTNPISTTLTAVITRADGRVEDLGIVGYWHRNPLRRLWFRAKQLTVRRTRI